MKKIKRIFTVLLALAITVGAVPFTVIPASAATTSDGLVYEISNGEVTITGYTGSATEFEIPSEIEGCPVTVIGDSAFRECAALESVIVPEGVTDIDPFAFFNCDNLVSITLPKTIKILVLLLLKNAISLRI